MKPTAADIYNRIVILKYVIVHAMSTPVETLLKIDIEQEHNELNEINEAFGLKSKENIDGLKKLKLWKYVSPKEKNFLISYGSDMSYQEHLNGMWRIEAIAMLLWSLNIIADLPEIDNSQEDNILNLFEIKKAGIFKNKKKMRPFLEIAKIRDIIELWHWRVRTRQLIEEDGPFLNNKKLKIKGYETYEDIIREAANKAFQNGDIKQIKDNDFVFFDKPFRDMDEDEYSYATSIIMERHFALNWVCGYAPRNKWDETPTDT